MVNVCSWPANHTFINTATRTTEAKGPQRLTTHTKDISSNNLVGHGLKFILHLLQECLHLRNRKTDHLALTLGHLVGVGTGALVPFLPGFWAALRPLAGAVPPNPPPGFGSPARPMTPTGWQDPFPSRPPRITVR